MLIERTSPAKGIRVLEFNRPEKRNALSQELIAEFLSQLKLASLDPTVRAIIVTGNGTFFSAGADLKEISQLDAEGARSCRYLEDLCDGMAAVRKPLLAAVNGPAIGGGFEVALMCDLIFATESAYFSLPETKLGLIPGAGGTQRLTAVVGKFRAMQTILTGTPISSSDAHSWGLVSKVAKGTSKVLELALATAIDMTAYGNAIALAKEAICRADSLCRDELFERTLYYAAFGTKEKQDGVTAFLSPDTSKV